MNRLILFAFLMSPGFLAAADVPEAKKAFATFVENQKNDSPRAFEQFAPDCRVTMVESDGKMNFEHQVPFNEFKKVLEVASKRKEGTDETYDEVVFKDQGESVSVNGTVHYSDPDFSGPFSLVLAKEGREEGLRITDFKITIYSPVTRIEGHDLYAFSMPGTWKQEKVAKIDLGDGKTLFPVNATSEIGAISGLAFESKNQDLAALPLKNFPMMAAGPILKKLQQQGATEAGQKIEALEEGDEDRIVYSFALKNPAGERMGVSGIVIRTKNRIYTIQRMGAGGEGNQFWMEVAKSFQEL